MKKLKAGIILFLAGQISTLFYKDKSFKDSFKSAEGIDKLKVLFTGICDLNKKLFSDIFEYDYSGKLDQVNDLVKSEKEKLEKSIDELMDKLNTVNKEKIIPILHELENKAKSFQKMIEEKITNLNEKYELDKKIKKIIEKIEELKKYND